MNVLLLLSDQHLATCLGHEGHPQVKTPNLDRLAVQSTRFRQAYTQNPICTPSRTSILSGQYCHNHGYYGLSGPAPRALPSFFSHFKGQGYRTAGIGNLHTPNDPRNWLESHLDVFLDYCESVDGKGEQTPFYDKLRKLGLLEKEDLHFFHHNSKYMLEGFPSPLPFELSQEGWCVEEAVKFMDGCQGRPFCIEVSLQRPHQPFTPDKRFWEMYPEDLALPPTLEQDPSGRPPHFQSAYAWFRKMNWPIEPNHFEAGARRLWRGYLGCVSHVDHAVGLLLDYLDRSGLARSTILIYTADHGAYSGAHGLPEKAPGICSDAVCRVPMIWRVPDASSPGSVCHQLVELVDIAPTIASLCGLPPMPTADGRDISGLLRGDHPPVREVAATEHPWSKAIRWKQWRFVHYQREMFGGKDVGELYDLERDPEETRNLYSDPDHQGIVQECRRLLLEWLIRTTRVVTVWPALDWSRHPYDYQTAGDGKESNTAGPAARVHKGQLNYI